MNIELKRVWKEVVIAYWKTLLQHLPEERNEIQEITCLDLITEAACEPGTSQVDVKGQFSGVLLLCLQLSIVSDMGSISFLVLCLQSEVFSLKC